jgi:hypothetical protein
MRNIITLKVIDYMEEYGCQFIKEAAFTNISCTDENRLPIRKIFDMIAGTSTGGVIAAALSVPSNDVMTESFSAKEILEVFKSQAPMVYAQQHINAGLIWIITIISTMIGLVLGLKRGRKKYANPNVQKTIRKIKSFLIEVKEAREEYEREKKTLKAAEEQQLK